MMEARRRRCRSGSDQVVWYSFRKDPPTYRRETHGLTIRSCPPL